MDTLKEELKKALVEALNLEDLMPNDSGDDKPLFADDGLGLDSIDALEIILILERNYGIRIADPKEGKAIFYSINTLADYVEKNRKK